MANELLDDLNAKAEEIDEGDAIPPPPARVTEAEVEEDDGEEEESEEEEDGEVELGAIEAVEAKPVKQANGLKQWQIETGKMNWKDLTGIERHKVLMDARRAKAAERRAHPELVKPRSEPEVIFEEPKPRAVKPSADSWGTMPEQPRKPAAVKPTKEPAYDPEKVERSWRRPSFFRGHLASLMPTAEHLKIWKRREDGALGLVPRTYSTRELEKSNDIEDFITRFIVPSYGSGDYEIALVNQKGEETRSHTITVLDPSEGGNVADNALAKTLDVMLARMEKLETRLAQPAAPQPSIKERLEEMEALQKMMGGKADPTTMALLMERMRPQATQASNEVAELKAELDRLKRDRRDQQSHFIPPPLPIEREPQQPAFDVGGVLKTVLEAGKGQSMSAGDIIQIIEKQQATAAAVAAAQAAATPRPTGLGEVVTAIAQALPLLRQALGLDQLQALQAEIRELKNQPSKGLKETLDDLAALQSVIGNNQPQSGGGEESFWGFLSTAAANLPAIAEMVGHLKGQQAQQQAQPPAARPKALPAPKANEEEDEPAEEQGLQIPEGFIPGPFAKVKAADNDEKLIEALLRSFQWLAMKNKGWMTHMIEVVKTAKKAHAGDGDAKAEVLEFVNSFMRNLLTNGIVDDNLVTRVKTAFETNFDKVLAVIVHPAKRPAATQPQAGNGVVS